ncbi:MAG TPA: hypothetical protein VJV78_11250 [Polyangiales bacterium]|nr:hypothetical protein [Polyangiales bacterium]
MSKALLTAMLLCAACTDLTVIVGDYELPVGGRTSVPGSGAGAGAAAGSLAGAPAIATPPRVNVDTPDQLSIEPGTRAQFCGGRGPAVRSVRPGSDCPTRIERRFFSQALCACEDLRLIGDSSQIDSYDSSQGTYVTGELGASIGVNGALAVFSPDTRVLGGVFASDDATLTLGGSAALTVSGDLKTNATLDALVTGTRIARDLWVGGDIVAVQDAITVGRDVYQHSGRSGGDSLKVGGLRHAVDTFDVPAPCACDPASLLDVAALVEQARAMNDNVAAGWSPDALKFGSFLMTRYQPLPCGRLYVNAISLSGDPALVGLAVSSMDISAAQRTALFVDGDVTAQGIGTLNLGTKGGELDVFIRGNLVAEVNTTIMLGSDLMDPTAQPRPAALRVFVGGDVILRGRLAVLGQLYAPQATIDTTLLVPDSSGSIFARSITGLGATRVHYDRAILRAGQECSAPGPQRCDGCHQCPDDQACIAGSCNACVSDADCCAPTICTQGKCKAPSG